MAIREDPLVILRFDFPLLDTGGFTHPRHVDLIVEVPDISDHGLVFHTRHMFGSQHIEITGRSHKNIGDLDDIFHSADLEALHRRL